MCQCPISYTTNICFGGNELRKAYATLAASGRLVEFDWPRPGLPLYWLNRLPTGAENPTRPEA